jgi:hypothetical protein
MQQAGRHAVEEIKNGSYDDEEQCQLVVALESEIGGNAT